MEQMVETPAKKNALLDLLILKNTEVITDCQVSEKLGNSDGLITFCPRLQEREACGYNTNSKFKKKLTPISCSVLKLN